MTSQVSSGSGVPLNSSAPLPLTDKVLEALAIAKRGVDELLIESEFAQKLARSEQSGKPLRIKLGLDPTAVFAATVVAALPTAQNVFTYAVRYGVGRDLARDTVLVTTVLTAPVVLVVSLVLPH